MSVLEIEVTSTEDGLQLIDAETNLPFLDSEGKPAVISYDAAGVSVGDAPQTTASLGLRWSHKGAYIKPRYLLRSLLLGV